MAQLKMERKPGDLIMPLLNEAFLIRSYKEGDWKGWTEACAEGLDTGNWTEQDFQTKMLDMEGLEPDGIFFVIDKDGRIAGTATGWMKPNFGYIHMVGMHTDYRGKGLAKALNAKAVQYLLEKGCKRIMLDTDDFRIPAIKVYLYLGFLPILYEPDMEERWITIMKQLGLHELEAYKEENGAITSIQV